HLRDLIIRPTLVDMGHYSPEAEALLLGIAAQEARGGRYLAQLRGPARGIYQMEPATHDDLWRHFLPSRRPLKALLLSWAHDPADPGSLANDVVVSIARDAEGRLWVGTLGGLDRMHGDSFVHYEASPEAEGALASGVIRALYRDSRGWLWVGTSGGGLYRYLPGTDSFLSVRSASSGLPSDYVFSIREDGEGRLWLALWFYGLSRYDPVGGTFENRRLEDGRAYFVNADLDGLVYVGTWGGGLFELSLDDGAIRRFTSDGERRWSLPHDTMYSMLVDRAGDAWVGTNGGGFSMLLHDEAGMSLYEHDPSDPGSLSSGKSISVLEDRRGRLWVGAYNGGVDRLDPGSSSFRRYRHDSDDERSLPNDIVVKIYEDGRGGLWFLTNDGLARYDEGRDAFERVRRDRAAPEGDAARILYDMVEEPGTGRYWIATYTSGLEYWDPAAGTVERLVFRTGPYRGDVRALFVEGEHATLGYTSEDLPGADQRVPLSVYYIDDVKTAAVGNP
ncbi:MAG TPA: two-component regulator propeller domain-containing protein, partial [Spirochaetales bacterium]|nr:two-component regulator propeller domain-containing protein [Spirochaetales bacterium]